MEILALGTPGIFWKLHTSRWRAYGNLFLQKDHPWIFGSSTRLTGVPKVFFCFTDNIRHIFGGYSRLTGMLKAILVFQKNGAWIFEAAWVHIFTPRSQGLSDGELNLGSWGWGWKCQPLVVS